MKENKNLSYKLQISLSSALCLVLPIYNEKLAFYRQKPRRERREKIGGANAPPNSKTKPQKRSFGCVSAARVWPGGHTLLVVLPDFAICFYLILDFSFQLLNLTKL